MAIGNCLGIRRKKNTTKNKGKEEERKVLEKQVKKGEENWFTVWFIWLDKLLGSDEKCCGYYLCRRRESCWWRLWMSFLGLPLGSGWSHEISTSSQSHTQACYGLSLTQPFHQLKTRSDTEEFTYRESARETDEISVKRANFSIQQTKYFLKSFSCRYFPLSDILIYWYTYRTISLPPASLTPGSLNSYNQHLKLIRQTSQSAWPHAFQG